MGKLEVHLVQSGIESWGGITAHYPQRGLSFQQWEPEAIELTPGGDFTVSHLKLRHTAPLFV